MRLVLTLIATLAAGPALAAGGTDPDWPCIQRKQPHLSLGQMWTGPMPDEATLQLARDSRIVALAERLEQRRLPMDQAEAQIAAFAETADNMRLTALMQAVLDRIEPDRSALIGGIARYGNRQVALARRIEERRATMAAMEAAETPDFDAIDAEERALDWDRRIFTERQQSLTYVCETPVILEQRAFALARAIASHLTD
ncbi:hypothetical protein [Paracoccus spongiarum]|uniref:DUF1311 domain-containing protein n=1 Tax=Paracoccus spongiarum TaxID=3064387 RepID=A0ABT9JB57_9RHOB|nr:hypothetical protein [Paracoccus sp. 2205BS29-5]MDP5307048.1 hypothetical protein [Paracoccus sp. 2205BS29-5]